MECGGLASPANGEVATSTTTFGSTATYSCNNGYILSGSATRNCQADAMWSSTEPTCTRKYAMIVYSTPCIRALIALPNSFFSVAVNCGGLVSPANGQVTASTTTLDSTATYSCNNGYTLSGSATRNCQADATWSSTEPTCTRKYAISIPHQSTVLHCLIHSSL